GSMEHCHWRIRSHGTIHFYSCKGSSCRSSESLQQERSSGFASRRSEPPCHALTAEQASRSLRRVRSPIRWVLAGEHWVRVTPSLGESVRLKEGHCSHAAVCMWGVANAVA